MRKCPCSMTTGDKDQLKDQKINNKRATRSDTTCLFLDPLNTTRLTYVINQVINLVKLINLG